VVSRGNMFQQIICKTLWSVCTGGHSIFYN